MIALAAKEGKRTRAPLTEEQRRLAEKHEWLARALIGRMVPRCRGLRDEIESAALLGLVEAAADWDEGRCVEFRAYARHRIVGAILDAMRKAGTHGLSGATQALRRGEAPRVFSIFATLWSGRDEELAGLRDFSDLDLMAADEQPVGWELEWEDTLKALSRKLPPRHAATLRFLYLHAAAITLKRAGACMGISESMAFNRHREAIAMIREAVGRKEVD